MNVEDVVAGLKSMEIDEEDPNKNEGSIARTVREYYGTPEGRSLAVELFIRALEDGGYNVFLMGIDFAEYVYAHGGPEELA